MKERTYILCFTFLFAVLGLCSIPQQALADDSPEITAEITGNALVESPTYIRVDGKEVSLWGIDVLEGDQQCWKNNLAWNCGEQGSAALSHMVEGHPLVCKIKEAKLFATPRVQCTYIKNNKKIDVAGALVSQGWALDKINESNSYYSVMEREALQKRLGIWTSRFQTAQDWKDGIERYVAYEMSPDPATKPAESSSIITGPAEFVVESESGNDK